MLIFTRLIPVNQYEIAVATKDGVTISEPQSSETTWEIASMVRGYE